MAQDAIVAPSEIEGTFLQPFNSEDGTGAIKYASDKRKETFGLGDGFNSLTGEIRGKCTLGKMLGDDSESFKTEYNITWVRSAEDYKKAVGLSAAASFGFGIWKADAASKYYRTVNRTKNSDYLVVSTKVEGPTFILGDPRLTDEARTYLSKADKTAFKNKCGNYYLYGVRTGGDFIATFSFESASETERAELQAKLKVVARGYGNGSAEFSQALETITKTSKLQVQIIRNGTSENVPEDDMEALVKYAKDFPTKINRDTALPIEFIRRDYQTIDPLADSYSDAEAQVERLSNYLGEASAAIADLDYAKGHLDTVYPIVDAEGLAATESAISSYIDQLQNTARICAAAPETCANLVKNTEGPLFVIPRRAQMVPINPKDGAEQFIGLAGSGQSKTLVILGQWSAWDNGDNLWWPPEQCCFDIVVQYEDGRRETRAYNPNAGPHTFVGPARAFVRLGDSTYVDNRERGLKGVVY
ncbi:hypothetical protein FJV76_27320 [Mesorhizobium sp. WSM4303]|uniref:hypothetical protein n=1 Tax=unclassified Mesorhizobium TaxID=325217 RepID=UPI00115F03CA|nr:MULTISPECIES: hypothetical protein [unclassified Mesorhizobium]TRC97344.1 hypothetical protein FJV76_27320 [Mesorhizobium sp. WSM4303]TRC99012.1 hypothetical protein FJV77_07005 [Mesorhizobium sp. WSM4306]